MFTSQDPKALTDRYDPYPFRRSTAVGGRLEEPSSRRDTSIGGMPAEVVYEISCHLPSIDRAALALASRQILHVLGENVLKLEQSSKYALLRRLERDGGFKSDILCSLCRIFHPPRLCLTWNPKDARRACVGSGQDDEVWAKITSPHLPRQVHFDIVAAITRNSRHGLTQYTTQMLASTTYHHHEDGHTMISCYVSAKVVNGRLLLKIEKFLFPRVERLGTLDAVPKLKSMLIRHPDLRACCAHYKWDSIHRFVFQPNPYEPDDTRRHNCLWTNGIYCWGDCCASLKQPCTGKIRDFLSTLRGCPKCHTDLAMTYKNYNDEGTILILTSWKDLGAGLHVDDASWKSHRALDPVAETPRRRPEIGSIYRAYESKREKHSRRYSGPSNEDWTVAVLRNGSVTRYDPTREPWSTSKRPSRTLDERLPFRCANAPTDYRTNLATQAALTPPSARVSALPFGARASGGSPGYATSTFSSRRRVTPSRGSSSSGGKTAPAPGPK
ncbi:hypothetical protein AK830_g6060 [Neonectria ditissima]|uniref:F-box domain-containing protein n=1 Tax=Neonectria ditissima TaxID=78410 RepID=A0A0P7BJE6_9HYPO|nr:hypothetical protein AK830_g6060 [Neonectria ditissima]